MAVCHYALIFSIVKENSADTLLKSKIEHNCNTEQLKVEPVLGTNAFSDKFWTTGYMAHYLMAIT